MGIVWRLPHRIHHGDWLGRVSPRHESNFKSLLVSKDSKEFIFRGSSTVWIPSIILSTTLSIKQISAARHSGVKRMKTALSLCIIIPAVLASIQLSKVGFLKKYTIFFRSA